MPKVRRDSQSAEESSSGGSSSEGKPLKKGPWTALEDEMLMAYVKKHGEGNWNAVQKYSGLSRCGKSCRLRWANHLRPNLKKGAFTPEEERLVIELHARMGNKWARMAAELPGRTDNEIKNFWNTRTKKLQRAGLPIYPQDVFMKAMEEAEQGQNMSTLPNEETHRDPFQVDGFEIPEVEFKNLDPSRVLAWSEMIPDFPKLNILNEEAISSDAYSLMFQTMPTRKRPWEPESLFQATGNSNTNFNQSMDQCYDTILVEPTENAFCNPEVDNFDQTMQMGVPLHNNHAISTGNSYSSSSDPLSWVMKLELPSLQDIDTHLDSWATPLYPLPSCESVDTSFQTLYTDQSTQSDIHSLRRNDSLDAVVHESEMRKNSKWPSSQQALGSFPSSKASDMNQNSSFDPGGTEPGANAHMNLVHCSSGYNIIPGSSHPLLMQSLETDQTRGCAIVDAALESDSLADGGELMENRPRDPIGDILGYDHVIDD